MSSRVTELLKGAIERAQLTPAEQGAFPYDVVLQTLEYLTEEYTGGNVQHLSLRINFERVAMRRTYFLPKVKIVMTSDFPSLTDSTRELLESMGWEFKVKPNLGHSELLMEWNHERVS